MVWRVETLPSLSGGADLSDSDLKPWNGMKCFGFVAEGEMIGAPLLCMEILTPSSLLLMQRSRSGLTHGIT